MLASNAKAPTATFLVPVVIEAPALYPRALLLDAVVFAVNAFLPTAVFLLQLYYLP